MSESDILNPKKTGLDRTYGDSMNPNVGWNRTRASNIAVVKPAFGRPWGRQVGNGGHSFTLNYTRRNLAVTNRLKQFFEQFELGFFTLVDHDMGRHYVGRFVGDMPQSFDINGRFSSTGWQFVELPGCPMLEYPSNWDAWAVSEYPIDDFGDQLTATSGVRWVRPDAIAGDDGVLRVPRQLQNLTPTAGDWATHEYRGYGFRLWAVQGPTFGKVDVYVDGTLNTTVDLYSEVLLGAQNVLELANLPLDIHRVKLVLTATKNDASTGDGMVLDHFEVMR